MKRYFLTFLLFTIPFWTYAQSAYTPKISEFTSQQDIWLESLHQCESQGRDSITILDSNNKYSYGGLQFQIATFMKNGKYYDIFPEELTDTEGLLLIHTYSIQKSIAKAMLDDGGQNNWKNCVKKIGNYPASSSD